MSPNAAKGRAPSRIAFAPSFSREADDIAVYIDEQFGENASDEFITNLMAVCTLIASFPGIGKTDHDYTTDLAGFPFKHCGKRAGRPHTRQNWRWGGRPLGNGLV